MKNTNTDVQMATVLEDGIAVTGAMTVVIIQMNSNVVSVLLFFLLRVVV